MLSDEYLNIEQKLYPIMNFLVENQTNEKYKSLYKGFITIQSPLILNPDILFIGINPGQGASRESKNRGINEAPVRLFDPKIRTDLDWYKDGNAKGCFIKRKWHAYKWYEKSEKTNNSFVFNMIEILYKVSELKFPDKGIEKNQEPFWYEYFGQNIMFTNLYPISTKDIKDLDHIFKSLSKEPSLKSLFGKSKLIRKWDVQRYFIRSIEDLVELVKPKTIVCIGTQTFNDFTFTTMKKTAKIFKGKKGKYPVIGFDRSGNWSKLSPEIAKEIVDELK